MLILSHQTLLSVIAVDYVELPLYPLPVSIIVIEKGQRFEILLSDAQIHFGIAVPNILPLDVSQYFELIVDR